MIQDLAADYGVQGPAMAWFAGLPEEDRRAKMARWYALNVPAPRKRTALSRAPRNTGGKSAAIKRALADKRGRR